MLRENQKPGHEREPIDQCPLGERLPQQLVRPYLQETPAPGARELAVNHQDGEINGAHLTPDPADGPIRNDAGGAHVQNKGVEPPAEELGCRIEAIEGGAHDEPAGPVEARGKVPTDVGVRVDEKHTHG